MKEPEETYEGRVNNDNYAPMFIEVKEEAGDTE